MTGNQHSESPGTPQRAAPVLFVDTLKFWGGGEQVFLQCARGLWERGFDVAVAARASGPLSQRAREHELPVLSLRGQSDLSFGDTLRLRGWLRDHREISVICATTRDVKLIRTATLGRRFGARVIWMMGSMVLRQRERDRTLATRATDHFVVPSQALKQELEDLGYLDPSRISVVPNGLDLSQWPPPGAATERGSSDSPIVGVFSRLDQRKGIDLLLEAWPEILSQYPAAQLWIAGTGPEAQALRAQAEPLGDSVTFHGYVENVRDLMMQVDLVVQPSRYEPFGMVLLEAMACARPVVCTSVGGMVEFVDESCGILVPPESSGDLAAAILALLADPRRARALGTSGRQRVENQCSLDRMIDRLQAVLGDQTEHP